MTRKEWFGYVLALPLVLPLLIVLVAKLAGVAFKLHTVLGMISFLAFMGFICGGWQYFLFAFYVYGWSKNKTPAEIWHASWVMPMYFWPWCMLWLLLGMVFSMPFKIITLIGLCAIPYGYFYVLCAHLLTWILARMGYIRD